MRVKLPQGAVAKEFFKRLMFIVNYFLESVCFAYAQMGVYGGAVPCKPQFPDAARSAVPLGINCCPNIYWGNFRNLLNLKHAENRLSSVGFECIITK